MLLHEFYLREQSADRFFTPPTVDDDDSMVVFSAELLAEISPHDFIALAAPGFYPVGNGKDKGVAEYTADVAQGKSLSYTPQLHIRVYPSGDGLEPVAQVVNHEGRHRSRALMANGYTSMPVHLLVIKGRSIPGETMTDEEIRSLSGLRLRSEDHATVIGFPRIKRVLTFKKTQQKKKPFGFFESGNR